MHVKAMSSGVLSLERQFWEDKSILIYSLYFMYTTLILTTLQKLLIGLWNQLWWILIKVEFMDS